MKKKILLSSILSIALCLSLIAGSTFALFTSNSEFNVSVTSGNVELIASVADLELYSAAKVEGTNETATMTDENGKGYYSLNVTANNAFTNGGTAAYADGVLTLDKVTPGDKVTFNIAGENKSNVAIQYRVKVACTDGKLLMSALNVKIGDNEAVTGLDSYTSNWVALAAEADMEDIAVSIELPITAGNEYKKLSTAIAVTVEAVQGNADVDDEAAIETLGVVSTEEEFLAALEAGKTAYLANDLTLTEKLYVNAGDKAVINLNGKTLTTPDGVNNYGVVLKGDLVIDGEGTVNVVGDFGFGVSTSGGSLTINGGNFIHNSTYMIGCFGGSVTINGGNFVGNYCVLNNFDGYTGVATVNGGSFAITNDDNDVEAAIFLGNVTVASGVEEMPVANDAASFVDAIAAGNDKVVLAEDIAVTERIAVNGDLTVLGNGATLAVSTADRAFNVDGVDGADVVISGLNIEVADKAYSRVVSVYNSSNVTVTVENCSLDCNYYPVNVAADCENVVVNVKDCVIEGYCAVNVWSDGTKMTFDNCTLIGSNVASQHPSNAFATIVCNPDTNDCELIFNNCRIEANSIHNPQWHVIDHGTDNTFTFNDCSFYYNGVESEMIVYPN